MSKPETRQKLIESAERFGIDTLHELVQSRLEKERAGRKKYEKKPMEDSLRRILKDLPNVRIYKDLVSFTFETEDELVSTLKNCSNS